MAVKKATISIGDWLKSTGFSAEKTLSSAQEQRKNLLQQMDSANASYLTGENRGALQRAFSNYQATMNVLRGAGYDTGNDVDVLRRAVHSSFDFQNQFKDEDDFNVSYAYPTKYKGKTRTDVNAALAQLKNTPGAEAEYDWLNKNQMNYWSADELKAQIGAWQNEISGIERQRRNMPRMAAGSTDADYAKRQQEALALSGQIDERKAKIGEAQSLLTRKTYDDEISKWDTQMQKALSDYSKALSVSESANTEMAMAGNSAFVVQNSDYATNARNTVRSFEQQLRDYGYSDQQINGIRNYALTQQHANEAAEMAQQVAQEAKEHPWLSSAMSVGTNMMAGAGALDIAAQNALNGTDPFTGEKMAVDRYTKSMVPSTVTNTIRGSVSEDMSGIGSFLYNAGMSIADTISTMVLEGATGLRGASEAILSGAAASQAITDAYDRGASDKEAVSLGVLYGAAEALFEHISLDKLRMFHTSAAAGKKTAKTLVKDMLKQSFVEGSEEVCTDIANVISDAIVMADKSEINQTIAAYQADGMSEDEATRRAWLDWLGQTAQDFAGGAISGGVMTGGDMALNAGMRSANYRETGRQITANDYADILRHAAEESGDENLRKLAGKKQTNRNTGKLYEATQEANLTQAVSDRLGALGAPENDVQELTGLVVKQIKGQELTGKEQRKFDASKQAQRASSEYASLFTRDADRTTNAWARSHMRDAAELERNAIYGGARKTDAGQTQTHQAEKNAEVQVNGETTQVQALRYDQESGSVELSVKAKNGDVQRVSVKDAKLPEGTRLLAESAEKYGETAPQMYANYKNGQDVERYASAYEVAYSYGRARVKNYAVLENSGAASYLTPEQRKFAYETGLAAARRESEAKSAAAKSGEIQAGSVTLEGGKLGNVTLAAVNTAGLTRKQTASIDVARKAAEAIGVNVVFFESQTGEDGKYLGMNGAYRDGTIYLDVNAGKNNVGTGETAILKTMSHELTHFIQQNSGQYEALKEFVANHVLESGDSIERLARQKLDNDSTGELTMDGAMDEVVADACEMMLRNTEAVQRLANENRILAEKIRDWIGDFVKKLRAAFKGDRATHDEARAMLDRMVELQKLWDDALVDAAKTRAGNNGDTASGRTQKSSRGKYLRPDLNQQEWSLLNRQMEKELDSGKQYLDEYTKWLYAEEKGVKVFALYGVGDGTEATALYAVGGKQATLHNANITEFVERSGEYDRDGRSVDSWVELLRRKKGSRGRNISQGQGATRSSGTAHGLYGRSPRGDGRRTSGRGSENQRKVKEQFSLREPVEQARDLVAVHGLTEQNLRGALALGGLPMPSIAVVKAAQGHSKYGPISIVFGRESIDPQVDSRNKIYGGDAYTPTAPAVEYPVNYDRMRAVENRISELSKSVANGAFWNSSALQRAGIGEESSMSAEEIAEKLARDDSVRAAYLADHGETLEPVMRAKEFNTFGNDALAKLVQTVGVQDLARIEADMETGDYQSAREIEDTVRQIIRDSYEEQHRGFLDRKPELKEKRIDHFMDNNVHTSTVENFIRDAWAFYEDQGATTGEVDRFATSDKLHEATDTEDVKAWLLPQLKSVFGEPGIYNGKERYTPSGDRRSFSQLHWEYTLENIVSAMAETQKERGGQTWGTSAGAMQAVSAEDFSNIDEVKAASGRLGKAEGEQYEAAKNTVEDLIDQATRAVMRETRPHADNSFDEREIIGDVMMEAAKGKRTTRAIQQAFAKEGYSVSEGTARRIQEVYRAAAALPTEYFEAKPQRAVGFDEVKVAIVPDNINAELKQRLEATGVPVREYHAGDEDQRLQILNSDKSWQFSERDKEYDDAVKRGDMETAQRMVDEAAEEALKGSKARLDEDGDYWQGEGKLAPVYHSTFSDFNVFDRNKLGENTDGEASNEFFEATAHVGFWFNTQNLSDGITRYQGGKALKCYLDINRMYSPGTLEALANDIAEQWDDNLTPAENGQAFADSLRWKRYDGIAVGDTEFGGISFVVLEPNQIKSADPVTYDDNGNVIPLSERFNSSSPDIRFSERDDTRTDRDVLSDAADGDAANVREMEMLREYREKLREYTSASKRLEKQRQIALTATDKSERMKAANRANNAAQRVSKLDEQLTRMQNAKPLRELVARELKTRDSLSKENAMLRDRVEYWRGQTHTTEEATTDPKAVREAAKDIIKQTGSSIDADEVAGRLQELYDGIARATSENGLSQEDIWKRAYDLAHDILDDVSVRDDMMYQEYSDLRAYFRNTQITLSPAMLGDFTDFGDFRRRNYGRMKLKKGEHGNVDQIYEEAATMWPGLFDSERVSNPGDQLREIDDVLNRIYTIDEYNPNDRYMHQAAQSVANEIIEQFFDTPEQKTFADRQAKKAGQQKTHYLNQINELRKANDTRIAELRAQNRKRLQEAIAREREKRDEQIARLKDRNAADKARREESAAVAKYRPRIEQKAKRLSDWLLKNSDKEHIPEPLKLAVGEFLESIDFTSKRALDGGGLTKKDIQRSLRYTDRMQKLLDSLRGQNEDGTSDLGLYLDIPDGFLDEMQKHINAASAIISQNPGENVVNRMNGEQLQQLDRMLTILTRSIQNANKLKANAHFETARQAAQATVLELERLGQAKGRTKAREKVAGFFSWDNTTPYYAFQRFGEGGKAIFEALSAGWDQMAFNTKKVMRFTEQTYKPEEVKAWSKETHTLKLESGKTVKMTTAQMMAFYCLSKREQAIGHLLGGGMRVEDIQNSGRKGNIKQANPFLLTQEDIIKINGALTKRQREVADKLQKYMTQQGSEWGNRVSMERFGYRAFTEENYFPIETMDSERDERGVPQKENDMFRLLNMSATKSLVYKANNALVVHDIFDVFANHMTDMAKYDALALPILDAMKWYNYREKQKLENGHVLTTTVQRSLEQAYGKDANKYFTTFIKDLNGVNEGGRGEGFAKKMLSNYKVAAVAANLRVVLLQPTAYVRAVGVMNPKYLVKAFAEGKSAYKEAEAYSGIALWKQMGFYDTNIGRNVRDQIKNSAGAKDWVVEKAMLGAEWADRLTWGRLWLACKAEVRDKQKLTGDALLKATAERFREVVYSTQVVDSTMTRSQAMRATGVYSAVSTAFMSEPTLSYNLLLKAYTDYTAELRATGDKKEAWRNASGKIARALAAYLVSAAASGLAESIVDACRDDDEYATWLEKYLSALIGAKYKDGKLSGVNPLESNLFMDVDILSKLPILKDFMSMISGYENDRMDTEWIKNLIDAYRIWDETIKLETGDLDEPTDVTYNGNMTLYGKIYKTLKAVSQATGLPISAVSREVVTLWNTIAGAVGKGDEWTIHTYDSGPENQIKYGLKDGYLTREEAQKLLLDKGLVDDEDDAYWKVDKWATGEGKYDEAFAAVLSGDKAAFDAQAKELKEHGIGEKQLQSAVRSQVREWYQGDDDGKRTVTKEQALKLAQQYGGKDADEAQKLVQQWTCKVVTGTDYDDIKDLYLDGKLTRSRAVDMLTRYGGMKQEDAQNKIDTADFVKAHPECDGISVEAVQKYNEQAKPAGLDAGTFWEAYQFKNDSRTTRDSNGKAISGQGAMDKVAAYIDGLGISSAQKSALFLCFYSQKSLGKIRWSN